MKIRSKCEWYEQGEKSSKIFLNQERIRSIRTVIYNVKEINDEQKLIIIFIL